MRDRKTTLLTVAWLATAVALGVVSVMFAKQCTRQAEEDTRQDAIAKPAKVGWELVEEYNPPATAGVPASPTPPSQSLTKRSWRFYEEKPWVPEIPQGKQYRGYLLGGAGTTFPFDRAGASYRMSAGVFVLDWLAVGAGWHYAPSKQDAAIMLDAMVRF
jgi:hypothetical protein